MEWNIWEGVAPMKDAKRNNLKERIRVKGPAGETRHEQAQRKYRKNDNLQRKNEMDEQIHKTTKENKRIYTTGG